LSFIILHSYIRYQGKVTQEEFPENIVKNPVYYNKCYKDSFQNKMGETIEKATTENKRLEHDF